MRWPRWHRPRKSNIGQDQGKQVQLGMVTPDPFAHHPELRDKIVDPLTSSFRTFGVAKILKMHPKPETLAGFFRSDADREATRAAFLEARGTGDLWVFAYGSLMWDPGFQFTDVRRATAAGFARRFILVDDKGGRGTEEKPGLMAALDQGEVCNGLAFRIFAEHVETETEILWRREMVGHTYVPTAIATKIEGQIVQALTFTANHESPMIRPNLTRADQVRLIARGSGFLGTSKDYLANIVSQFALLGIADADCSALLKEVENYAEKL